MSATVKDELTFGSELYRLRNRAGMTQARVADSAGITRGYYSQLENSRRPPPPLEKVRRIAESMELPPSDLRLLWGIAAIERILRMIASDDTGGELAAHGSGAKYAGIKMKDMHSLPRV